MFRQKTGEKITYKNRGIFGHEAVERRLGQVVDGTRVIGPWRLSLFRFGRSRTWVLQEGHKAGFVVLAWILILLLATCLKC